LDNDARQNVKGKPMTVPRHYVPVAWLATGLVCVAAFHASVVVGDESPKETASPTDERLKDIIQRVEAEEARYQRLETVIRFQSRFAQDDNKKQFLPAAEERWHAIIQGDLFWFRVEDTIASEPDETIDGLGCAKVHCRSWYGENREPTVDVIWLAKQRNYLCLRSQTRSNELGAVTRVQIARQK
jgi:hypothetical protein